MLELATLHYSLTLKARGLHAFKHYLHHRRKTEAHKEQAVAFAVKSSMQRCWAKWLQRCEHNEEISLGPLTRRARHHAATKLSHRVMAAWVQYVIHRRQRNRLKSVADTHFREVALPK